METLDQGSASAQSTAAAIPPPSSEKTGSRSETQDADDEVVKHQRRVRSPGSESEEERLHDQRERKELERHIREHDTAGTRKYRMPDGYDQEGGVNQDKRFAVAVQHYSDPAADEKMNPSAEQEAWEEHQIGKATLKFGSKDEMRKRDDYEFVFEDQIEASVMDGVNVEQDASLQSSEASAAKKAFEKPQSEEERPSDQREQEELERHIRERDTAGTRKMTEQKLTKKEEEYTDDIEDLQYLFGDVKLTEAEYRKQRYKKETYELLKKRTEESDYTNEYRMPDAYDQEGGVNQDKRFAVAVQRYSDPAGDEKMNPSAEQEAWEEHQIGKATLKFGSKDKKRKRDDSSCIFFSSWPNKRINVGNQRDAPACWVFATCTDLAYESFIGHSQHLVQGSQQNILNHWQTYSQTIVGLKSCEQFYEVLAYVCDVGIKEEDEYPYRARKDLSLPKPKDPLHKACYYVKLAANTPFSVMQHILCKHAVICLMGNYRGFDRIAGIEKRMFTLEEAGPRRQGRHAMVIMGVGLQGGKNFYLLHNSYGPEWGDRGFCKVECCLVKPLAFFGYYQNRDPYYRRPTFL